MPRMLGKVSPPWCNICKAPPGPDCPDEGKGKRQVRAAEQRELADIVDEVIERWGPALDELGRS